MEAFRCLELFLDHLDEHGGAGRRRQARQQRQQRAETAAPPQRAETAPLLAELLAPPEREALRQTFTHYAVCAGGPPLGGVRAVMGLPQWLVLLREAGVASAAGLPAAVAAFDSRAREWGADGGGGNEGRGCGGQDDCARGRGAGAPQVFAALDFDSFLAALEAVARAPAWAARYGCPPSSGTEPVRPPPQQQQRQPQQEQSDAALWGMVDQLLTQQQDLLIQEGAPTTTAFFELFEVSGGASGGLEDGGGGGSFGSGHGAPSATCRVAGAAWPDQQLLALYSRDCLDLLCSRAAQQALRSLFRRFSEGGATDARRCTALLRACALVAPACGRRGGRGLTALEGRLCAFASRPPRLQRGTPNAPDPLSPAEFQEWAGRAALVAFGWRPDGGQAGGGGGGGERPAAALPFGPEGYSSAAKRLWVEPPPAQQAEAVSDAVIGCGGVWGSQMERQAPHLATFSTAWVGEPRAGACRESCGRAESPPRPPFDTTSSFAGIAPLEHTAAQHRAIQHAAGELAAAEAEAAAQRMLRHAAARLAGIEGRAAAAARREELQRRARQRACGGRSGGENCGSEQLMWTLVAHGTEAAG
ncbi:hypothetical protein Rsub_01248 [Raphidocelis subcapitata]|uniref:Uncharacterized protein n=1 Tax=Raphidocelis subcapitata TaxID=307507 RepID=A0A2V0NSM1_9CHLO|nr:hypothetical protein Rsub_01248 [Raphidocelis subcapitata]|eukprot:GBF88533.1 hypothetical protein Rsub_01248 [Raphidocelis subcapitata]